MTCLGQPQHPHPPNITPNDQKKNDMKVQTLLYNNLGTTRVALSNRARTTALQTCCQTEGHLGGIYEQRKRYTAALGSANEVIWGRVCCGGRGNGKTKKKIRQM